MAYSLTFNLLALLCTSPSGRAPCGLLPVLCLLFRFVLQGLIIKTSFLDILSVFWKVREGNGLSLVSGAEALSPLVGKGVELLRHFHVNAVSLVGLGAHALGTFLWESRPNCFASSLISAEVLASL